MLKDSEGRCTSTKAAVPSQQPWRRFIRNSILPKRSSRESEHCQRLPVRYQKYTSREEEEEERNNSSSNSEVAPTCNDVPFEINERLKCIGCSKRRPSFSDTESVLDIVKMPVGTTNSVLKSSFSLTSLRSSTPTYSPEHGAPLKLKTERAYHSLTKKSRQGNERDTEQWRKSWGSGISQEGKEFWEGFQADYDYLMSQNILDRDTAEVPPENRIPRAPFVWSHSEFMDHFAQLYSWLRDIQDSVYGKEENVTDWKLRAERLEDMQRQRFRLDNFKEESKNLIVRYPDSEGEVVWLVKHISDKWEALEAIMGGYQKCEREKNSEEKIKHEIRCLRKWLKEMDTKLKPLSFQRGWTKAELEAKSKEITVLHRDLESQKKVFSSVLKLCEKEKSRRFLAILEALERKYHLHYLNFLEWECYIKFLSSQPNMAFSNVNNESDGEPLPKIPRFVRRYSPKFRYEAGDYNSFDGLKSDEEFSEDDDKQMEAFVDGKNGAHPSSRIPFVRITNGTILQPKIIQDFISVVDKSSNNANTFVSANHETDPRSKSEENISDGEQGNQLRDTNTAAEFETYRPRKRLSSTDSVLSRHLDTDSEQEAMSEEDNKRKEVSKENLNGKDLETTSSDHGWTYKSGAQTEKFKTGFIKKPKTAVRLDFKKDSAKNIPPMLNNQVSISWRKLVELADELVRNKPSKTWKTRRGRTKKDAKKKVLDSYDASGEYTEEDSDDGEGTLTTSRKFGSADGISEEKSPFKFVPRRCRHVLRTRPLSMSSVSGLKNPREESLKSQTSVSESALNRLMELEMCCSTSARWSKAFGEDGGGSSSKRKRMKSRKQTNKKSDSESGSLRLSGNDSPSASSSGSKISMLVKPVKSLDRDVCEFGSLTGTETEEEACRLIQPVFRLGPDTGAVTVTAEQDKTQVEEQLSLNWDNFQEKYQSEACSEEPPDSDTAKKILEFGEDYGKYLGNQSDCASTRSWSFTECSRSKIDSESDVDESRQTLRHSLEQLNLWKIKFNENFGGVSCANDFPFDSGISRTILDEILGACKRNMECLTKLLLQVKDEMLLAKEHNYILNVKESWENLKTTAELHKAKQLRREMALLKEELLSLGTKVDFIETTVTSREELEAKITQVQDELNLIKNGKTRLLQANVSVHRFLASAKTSDVTLRDEVTELYQLWDQTFRKISSHLSNFQSLSQTWHDFEDHLAQLQCALRTDTLKVLDFALKCGSPSLGASLSLQDIAGILSDKESGTKDALSTVEVPTNAKPMVLVPATLSTEGSLSDSGISDSGSEQELNEREKRLAQLKRLAKRLESILAPGSQALSNMFKRIEQAESELRELQKTCRDLIVRSASTEEIRMIVTSTATLGNLDLQESSSASEAPQPSKQTNSSALVKEIEFLKESETDGVEAEDSEGTKPGRKFWFWRLLRYALPFQLALFALLCIASVMEPRCCDSLNNLELSLNPQLRYNSGPPPV